MIYHTSYTSSIETTYKRPPFIKVAIVFWCSFIKNHHGGCTVETIKLIPYYIIDIIYKTLKPLHLKKMQIIQNIKNLIFHVIFIFSDWILIKQIKVSSTPFCCWEKQIFERMLPGGMSNFLLPRAWWQELGGQFWVGKGMSKNAPNLCIFWKCEIHKFESFSHTWWNIKVWEKIQQ